MTDPNTGKVLVKNANYSVSYVDNVDAGTATARITSGIVTAGYGGYAEAAFQIAKAQSGLEARALGDVVTCTTSPTESVVTGRNLAVAGVSGTVTYQNASLDATAAKFYVGLGTGIVSVPAGTPAGTYQVRVSVADAGDANHEAGTATVSYLVRVQSPSGWLKEGGSWYYYANEGKAKGWQKLGGRWYYLDPSTGAMSTGWRKVGSAWYHFGTSGAMATGWLKVGSAWYYLKDSGAMAVGWAKVGSAWYYFNASGAMLTGWQKVGSAWYYLKDSGAMAVGWAKVGSAWYYFSGSGAMVTGWQKVGSTWYYLQPSGAMATDWLKIGSTWYYFNSSGSMLTGRQNIGGKWYTFNVSGAWVG